MTRLPMSCHGTPRTLTTEKDRHVLHSDSPEHASMDVWKSTIIGNGLKVAHMNIRSCLHKMEERRLIMKDLPVDILSVNETFLDDTIHDNKISIPGYSIYRNDRGSRHGGGVALYVRADIPHQYCYEITFRTSTEACWVKIKHAKPSDVAIGTIYCPPSADQEYYNAMLDTIKDAATVCEDVVLLDDFNYNYANGESNPVKFIEQIYSMGQLITEPTRVTATTSTTLDLIFTTMAASMSNWG